MSVYPKRILAISGSLRPASSNTRLLEALVDVGPPRFDVRLYDGIDRLPYFNPDLDGETVPASVSDLRHAVSTAAAVVICSPEYAHGVPGVLKNALDWLVGSVACEIVGKPVFLANLSPRSTFAVAQLAETLSVMGATVAETIVLDPLPVSGSKLEVWKRALQVLEGLIF